MCVCEERQSALAQVNQTQHSAIKVWREWTDTQVGSSFYLPSSPLARHKDARWDTLHTAHTEANTHTHKAVEVREGYSCRRMMQFINGKQADSLTFSLEKMINATRYIGMRKQKKEEVLHSLQRAETFAAATSCLCVTTTCCAGCVCKDVFKLKQL